MAGEGYKALRFAQLTAAGGNTTFGARCYVFRSFGTELTEDGLDRAHPRELRTVGGLQDRRQLLEDSRQTGTERHARHSAKHRRHLVAQARVGVCGGLEEAGQEEEDLEKRRISSEGISSRGPDNQLSV